MRKFVVFWPALVLMMMAGAASGQFFITLDQNYDGAPENMIVQTDAYGNLTGDRTLR